MTMLPPPGAKKLGLSLWRRRVRPCRDLGDLDSEVSRTVAAREGYALLPELGYRPVNRYLPPRSRRVASPSTGAWRQRMVTPLYLLLALAAGGLLLNLQLQLIGQPLQGVPAGTALLLAAGAMLKARYWVLIDRLRPVTTGQATGPDRFGAVRVMDLPSLSPPISA